MTALDDHGLERTTAYDERGRLLGRAVAETKDEALDPSWEDRPGLWGFFTTVDHKKLGMRYIYTAFVFFFLAGLQALFMRVQLASPDNSALGAQTYNQLFTMHGTTMIFLFNTPVFAGFANYLLPLQLGSRDLAFPRLNAFSYWIYVSAGIFMYASFLTGDVPDGGWFAYTPLTEASFSPSRGMDFWGLGVTFVGISTTVGAINFIVTIFKLRAPGMTVNRIPLFGWATLTMSFMIIFAVPSVTLASFMLELDRLFGAAFFDPARGGSPILYQHLFWFWGHPEVYILFLPAVGIMLTTIPVFSRTRLAGYLWAVGALTTIAFISFGVWVHHMFATGLSNMSMGVFSAASQVIAIPSGVLYLVWIVTLMHGRVKWTSPMLFSLGFLLIFLMGGITGVMVSVMPFDWQVHDSYFVVAHFHYVLNGAVVFPIFAGMYYWLPKMTGKMLSERLGHVSFWIMFVSFHLAFFPMHVLGLLGMPRRIYTYASGLGWGTLNLVVSIGSFCFAFGVLLSLVNVVWSRRRGAEAGPNPWGADTLEWATSSPPPEYNFANTPIVADRHPLWTDPPIAVSAAEEGEARSLSRQGAWERAVAVTTGLSAEPHHSQDVPRPTWLPAVAAGGILLFFVGLLYVAEVAAWLGVAVAALGVGWWMWRTGEDHR